VAGVPSSWAKTARSQIRGRISWWDHDVFSAHVTHTCGVREVIELKIVLDPVGGGRLAGSLLTHQGEARPFDGWLGLISALDAELSPAGLDTPTPVGPSPETDAAHIDES
jgi:hypothetical protein